VSYAIPERFAQMARARRATVVLSARNLGVPWTRFPGIDPEMNGTTQGNNANWSSPPLKYFIGRVNLSF
jgi:hypothetical protein